MQLRTVEQERSLERAPKETIRETLATFLFFLYEALLRYDYDIYGRQAKPVQNGSYHA